MGLWCFTSLQTPITAAMAVVWQWRLSSMVVAVDGGSGDGIIAAAVWQRHNNSAMVVALMVVMAVMTAMAAMAVIVIVIVILVDCSGG